MPQSLTELLAQHERARPTTTALVYADVPITYAALAAESRRVAQGLADLGVTAGDRVALWLPNVPAWLTCFFACAQLGAIVVTVNTRVRSNEVADIVGRAGAKVLLFWPGFRHIDFAGILRDVPPDALANLRTFVAYDESDNEPALAPLLGRPVVSYRQIARSFELTANHARPDAGCIIFTTSGTTRAPKFVLHNQASITRHAADMARGFGIDAEDATTLLTVPLCGVFGLCNATATLAAGRPLVMLPTFEAQAAAKAIHAHQITHFAAVGDIVAQLLAANDDKIAYPSVRMVIGARTGQAAPAQARGVRLVGVYGMSEVQGMLSLRGLDEPPETRELGGGTLVAAEGRVRARDPGNGEILAARHERRARIQGAERDGGLLRRCGGDGGRVHARRLSQKRRPRLYDSGERLRLSIAHGRRAAPRGLPRQSARNRSGARCPPCGQRKPGRWHRRAARHAPRGVRDCAR
jgi:fatty-acyl-CoA synthase